MLEGLLNRIFRILLMAKYAEGGMIDFRSMVLVPLSENARMSRLCTQNERLVIWQYAVFAATPCAALFGAWNIHHASFLREFCANSERSHPRANHRAKRMELNSPNPLR